MEKTPESCKIPNEESPEIEDYDEEGQEEQEEEEEYKHDMAEQHQQEEDIEREQELLEPEVAAKRRTPLKKAPKTKLSQNHFKDFYHQSTTKKKKTTVTKSAKRRRSSSKNLRSLTQKHIRNLKGKNRISD